MTHTAAAAQSSAHLKSYQHVLIVAAICLVAFGVRGCVVLQEPEKPIADAADYHQIATSLADGHGYVNSGGEPTAWRPPGYPIFLSLIYRVSGPSVTAATIVQSFVGALTVLMLMLFGSTI